MIHSYFMPPTGFLCKTAESCFSCGAEWVTTAGLMLQRKVQQLSEQIPSLPRDTSQVRRPYGSSDGLFEADPERKLLQGGRPDNSRNGLVESMPER